MRYPLSQMTFTPPHHYRYTQNMIFEAKLVFRRSFYVIQNDEMEVRDEGVVDQNYLLKTKTLCLPSTASTLAFARQHRLQILALQCSTVQCNPVEGTVLESFFLPPPPPPPHSFPHPSPLPPFTDVSTLTFLSLPRFQLPALMHRLHKAPHLEV